MVKYNYQDLFKQDSIDKQILIRYGNTTITNEDLFSQNMTLTESLCSEQQLRFGSCEASSLKIRIANIVAPMIGQTINVDMYLNNDTNTMFSIGKYKVQSDKPTADRVWRDIVAYDAMYDIINTDVSEWYNRVLPDPDSTMTLRNFRTSFLNYFGMQQEEITLVNDNMLITKNIEPSELSGRDVITAICEINGCFGHIGRNGKFKYIYLPTDDRFGLYPSNTLYPSDNLYPKDSGSERIFKSYYISCEYEDFMTQDITKLQIRQEENDIGCIYGDGDNTYIIEDNFLVYGKSHEELTQIAQNLLPAMSHRTYRPANINAKGNPCYEVGDAINVSTRLELVETFILSRTLSGIQALKDTYTAKGTEQYEEKVNSVHKSIIQLKGKTNTLTRTVEETKSEIKDLDKNIRSEIKQTAESITAEVAKTYETKTDAQTTKTTLDSKIDQTAKEIRSEVKSVTQMYDTTGYTVKYQEAKAPNIDVEVDAIWLDTSTGDLYEGVYIPEEWLNLGDFHGAQLSGSTECRWYKVGAGTTIYRTYGVGSGYRAGWDMQKQGDFNQEPPTASSYPINTWWLNIRPYYKETERKYTLEQYLANLDNCEKDDYMTLYEKKSNARYEWRHIRKCPIITLSDIGSEVMQLAGEIVLKVRADGRIASVQLKADPESGTEFKVKADNISLSAADVFKIMGNKIDLTAHSLTINSDNFKVDSQGNIQCKSITAFKINGDAVNQFSTAVNDSHALEVAYEAINAAKNVGEKAQKTVDDLNNEMIPQINTWINQLSGQLRELGKPGIS